MALCMNWLLQQSRKSLQHKSYEVLGFGFILKQNLGKLRDGLQKQFSVKKQESKKDFCPIPVLFF